LNLAKATPEQVIMNDAYHLRALKTSTLVNISVRNTISWQHEGPYNKRWQYKWQHAYYASPKEGVEQEKIRKPEDSKVGTPLYHTWIQDLLLRWWPGLRVWWERRHRMYDNFSVYFLPGSSFVFYQLADITMGFKILSILPWFILYVRIRDRTMDPDFKETYLRDMLYRNEQVSALFSEETIHVLDYDCEYDKTIDHEKFPEYTNKLWQFFNTDTSMTTGHFKFGDVESGATMNLKFKTMPASGKFRYQVGEPFYFYDLRADIVHNGAYKEVVLVDEKETLNKMRPFLFLI